MTDFDLDSIVNCQMIGALLDRSARRNWPGLRCKSREEAL